MNWMLFVSGAVCAFCTFGHFTMGSRDYLKPMLGASFEDLPKRVMHAVFHYVSVSLVLSTAALLVASFLEVSDVPEGYGLSALVLFVAAQFALFAVVQLIVAFASRIERAAVRMFQWIIFAVISVFAFLGVLL